MANIKTANEYKYYEIQIESGHVGIGNHILITYGVKALSQKEASEIGRNMARAKHHSATCVRYCVEITPDKYKEILCENEEDLYLKIKSKRQQKDFIGQGLLDLSGRVFQNEKPIYKKDMEKNAPKTYKKQKIKNLKKFINKYSPADTSAYDFTYDTVS